MSDSADAMRRWLGLFFLAVAGGMLIWGRTILEPHLEGMAFVFYWMGCFGFTMAAIVVALLDVRAVRRRTRREQAELIQRTLDEIETEAKEKEKPPGDGSK